MIDELIIPLSTPVEAAHEGQNHKFVNLTIKPPKLADHKYYYPIADIAKKSFQDWAKNEENTKRAKTEAAKVDDKSKVKEESKVDEIADNAQFVNYILSDCKVDYSDLITKFENLFIETDCVKLGGKVKFTQYLFYELSLDDIQKIIGAYIHFFILPS